MYFDGSMSDDDAKQVQRLMKLLSDKGFNGSVQCCNGEYSSVLFYLDVISYHWREVNQYNLRHP